jgi:GrpB-like predicted nucleotidyltransferase (UPF0157 family)
MPKQVIVTDYDPAWPAMFERLRAPIWAIIGDVATSIEHVGSTAVPGLAAKPIIDITIVVPTPAALAVVIERLPTLGYTHRGDLGVPGREAFRRAEGTPTHHLYACVAGADALRNHLAVRDSLRQDPGLVRAYGDLKKHLADRFTNDIDGYIDGKTEFILAILAKANLSAEQLAKIRAINSLPNLVRPTGGAG